MGIEISQVVRAADTAADASVTVPTYDRDRLRRAIVHLGVGGFHRAHLATYVHELCTLGNQDWSIVGAGVLAGDASMAATMEAQDCLYALITRGSDSTEVDIIASIVDYIHAAPDAAELIEAIADPATQIVSLTVTEGGYPVDDLTGEYLESSPVAGPDSAFGILAAGLDQRRARGAGGLTVISCDNVIGNGKVARAATLGEANRRSGELAAWIGETVTFPNSMVDRITPGTTDADRTWLEETHDIVDRWPVVTEPFRQWVIEDVFAGDRLPLDQLDVIVTDDVEPYELMKLRMLNAAHSCLAYLSALAGIETVDRALADPAIRAYTSTFLENESQPVLDAVPGIDLPAYTSSIIERFANPNIGDQIARLCSDGSAKFPKFLLPTIRLQLDAGGPISLGSLALAAWCEYLTMPRDQLAPDPLLDEAVAHATRSQQDPMAFLEFDAVFDDDLRGSERFRAAFGDALSQLREHGVRPALDAILE